MDLIGAWTAGGKGTGSWTGASGKAERERGEVEEFEGFSVEIAE